MTDLLTDGRKAIDFVVRYSKSINQHPQPASLIDVAERLVTEVERLRRKLQAIRNWTDLQDETPAVQAIVEIERICKEAFAAKEPDDGHS